MRVTHTLVAALACGLGFASPLAKRTVTSDLDVLNYALTLVCIILRHLTSARLLGFGLTKAQEFLERRFYVECLTKFSPKDFDDAGFDHVFYKNLLQIALDEQAHVDFIIAAIRAVDGKPVSEAKYAFPLSDARSCITLASVLEGVGVSA